MADAERQDRQITCRECKSPFTFTVGEQEFYESRQLHDPVRCKECRERRKAEKLSQGN